MSVGPYLRSVACRGVGILWPSSWAVLVTCIALAGDVGGQVMTGAGQADANWPAVAAQIQQDRPCPFAGQIIGDDVYVRSGPGTDFYACGKLFRGDRVQVVKENGGWSQIVPPAGSFSWVHMQYLCISLKDPTEALITGDDVPAYAGSESVAPIHSTSKQATLKRGDRVRLLGQERDGYLKIACPQGACLWVSSRYVVPVSSVSGPAMQTTEPNQPSGSNRLQEFYRLQEQFKAEIAKPLAKQDFTAIRKALEPIAQDQKAREAALYAGLLLERITNCEVAKQAQLELQRQDKALAETMAKIEAARNANLRSTEDLNRFCVVGVVQTSNIYTGDATKKMYRILDDEGRILCYAQPDAGAKSQDLEDLVGQKVGLVGTVQPHPPTGSALAVFTQAVRLP